MPITADEQPDLLNVSAYYQRAQGNFWVASDTGQMVATIGLLDVGDARGVLRKMFVAASIAALGCSRAPADLSDLGAVGENDRGDARNHGADEGGTPLL